MKFNFTKVWSSVCDVGLQLNQHCVYSVSVCFTGLEWGRGRVKSYCDLTHWINVVLALVHRLRRWTSVKKNWFDVLWLLVDLTHWPHTPWPDLTFIPHLAGIWAVTSDLTQTGSFFCNHVLHPHCTVAYLMCRKNKTEFGHLINI